MNPNQETENPAIFELHWPGLGQCLVEDQGSKFYLIRLCVKDAWQGQGIGRSVVRQLQRRGIPIEVCSLADNAERQPDLDRFYYGLGFRPSQRHWVSPCEDNLVWTPPDRKPFSCDLPIEPVSFKPILGESFKITLKDLQREAEYKREFEKRYYTHGAQY